MSRPTQGEKSWVQSMVEKSQRKDDEPKPVGKNNDVDIKEVENIYKDIQRKLQRGELR